SAGDVISLHFTDLDVLADELASFGPEVLVLSPPELRSAVRHRLRKVTEVHGGVLNETGGAA
ncbi:MAG: transcriptional regulator, partial [Cryobacterium sp.]|nr:transcriptional regulator [Cryobacterium sp.]